MIDVLTIPRFASYDLMKTARQNGGGGGMCLKMSRVMEILGANFPGSRMIVDAGDIRYDSVVVDFAWFVEEVKQGRWSESKKRFEEKGVRKCIGMGSELSFFRMTFPELQEVLKVCDRVTVNCDFLAQLLEGCGIGWFNRLIDPIPDMFFDDVPVSERKPRVVAAGNVSWFKNSQGVVDVFRALEGRGVERVYIGSASFWGDSQDTTAKKLERELYASCDVIHEDVPQAEVAALYRASRVGVWCAYHDVFATAVHEMIASGLMVVSAPHGLAYEMPVDILKPDARADKIVELATMDDEEWLKRSEKCREWARNRVSVNVFLAQLRGLLA